MARCQTPSALFLYDVTSSYLEGKDNALGAFYISALSDPQSACYYPRNSATGTVRRANLRGRSRRVRYILRQNPEEARRIGHRPEDKLVKLRDKIAQRNQLVEQSFSG